MKIILYSTTIYIKYAYCIYIYVCMYNLYVSITSRITGDVFYPKYDLAVEIIFVFTHGILSR